MYKATIASKDLKAYHWFYNSDGFVPFFLGFIITIAGVFGWVALAEAGLAWFAWLAIVPAIIYIGITINLWRRLENPYIICCRYRSLYDDDADCNSITKLWCELNEDNKQITLPLIRWVYEHRHANDTYDKPMFINECNLRQEAVRKVLDEQKKIEYHKPDVDDSDVHAVLEYAEAMKHARETLYPDSPAL